MHKQIEKLRTDLNTQFPERKEVIDGALCAVLAREHVLLLGPPGTAKSALVRAIAGAFGASYYERLLDRFSTPETLFGPVSLKALEQDRYVRNTAGQLPAAHIAFLDEIFKSNNAVLNSLLGILNERKFANGDALVACPLITMFGASNELPEGPELQALQDRMLLRFDVRYMLRDASFRSVLAGGEPTVSTQLTLSELATAQADVAKVKLSDATIDALIEIRDACRGEGIIASDRRWKKTLRVVQAAAYLAGEKQTSAEDLGILVDMLWRVPNERPKLARLVGRLADPVGSQAQEVLDAARETAFKTAGLKNGDRKSYIAAAASAVETFDQQQRKLAELAKTGGRRARTVIADATSEIQALHAEMARTVSQGLGLRALR